MLLPKFVHQGYAGNVSQTRSSRSRRQLDGVQELQPSASSPRGNSECEHAQRIDATPCVPDGEPPSQARRVIAVIAKQLYRVDPERVVPSALFSDDLGADSLDKVEVIMALEDEFGVAISDIDAERIFNVRDAIDYVVHALRRKTG